MVALQPQLLLNADSKPPVHKDHNTDSRSETQEAEFKLQDVTLLAEFLARKMSEPR